MYYSVYFFSVLIIMVNVIGCSNRLHINQLIIFPLIIQRRRKLRVCAAFVFIHDYLRGHYVNYTIWQRAQASTVATSAENSEMIIGFISPLVFIPAKYTADM